MNSESEEKILAEAMAWLEEKELQKDFAQKEQENSEKPDVNGKLPFYEESPAEFSHNDFYAHMTEKQDSELPTLQLQYSFTSLLDDLCEESYCKRNHVDIIRNENLV